MARNQDLEATIEVNRPPALAAERVSVFLAVAFRQQPKDSGVARFLRAPNGRGWDLKRKLVWAGQHSYLFRHQCAHYLEESGTGTTDINVIDDFICQHYRYCPDLARKARDAVGQHHRQFVAHHNDDLAIFSDGLSLAAAVQKRMRALFDARPRESVADVMKCYGLHNPWPRLEFPGAFLQHSDGIGAFFNPDEGEEYMLSFNQVCSAFRKQDLSLTDNKAESVRALIENEAISPAFVQRLVREYGCGAIGWPGLPVIRGFSADAASRVAPAAVQRQVLPHALPSDIIHATQPRRQSICLSKHG
jgi:hypothetical protein